jgi:hypothetical protein
MHIRVTTDQTAASRADEITSWGNDRLNSVLLKLPGFKGCHGGADRQTGGIVAATLWDTREQAERLREAVGEVFAEPGDMSLKFDVPKIFEETVSA